MSDGNDPDDFLYYCLFERNKGPHRQFTVPEYAEMYAFNQLRRFVNLMYTDRRMPESQFNVFEFFDQFAGCIVRNAAPNGCPTVSIRTRGWQYHLHVVTGDDGRLYYMDSTFVPPNSPRAPDR
jgi:hypothetical protein